MPRNMRADETLLNAATTNSNSLRVTIPGFIVAKMDLKKGDKFRWHIVDKELRIEVIQEQ